MAKYCNLALHSTVKKVLNNQPWFKYEDGDKFIEVTTGGYINEHNINGKIVDLKDALNTMINNGRKLGQVFYATGKREIIKGIRIMPTERQMALLDAEDEATAEEAQKEVDSLEHQEELEQRQKEIEGEEELLGTVSISESEKNKQINIQNESEGVSREDGENKERGNETGLNLEGINIPKNFSILWKDRIDGSPKRTYFWKSETVGHIQSSRGLSGNSIFDQYILHSPFYKRIAGKSIREIFRGEKVLGEGLDVLERNRIQQTVLGLRIAQSIYGNSFNRGLAERLGLDRIHFIDDSQKPPMFVTGGLLYINTNERTGFLNSILSIASEEDEGDYISMAVSEELIHLVSKQLTTESEVKAAYSELTESDKIKIKQSYFDTQNVLGKELSEGQYVHEYVRMKIQEKIFGKTTEKVRNRLNAIIQHVWNYIKDLIPLYRNLNEIYNKTLQFIETGEGEFVNKEKEEILGLPVLNQPLNDFYDVIKKYSDKLEIILDPKAKEKKDQRYYTYEGQRIAKSVTEKIKEKQTMPERSEEQRVFDDMKKEWGIEGHAFVENYIKNNLIDENGYIRPTPLSAPIDTPLSESQQKIIKAAIGKIIYSYPTGTRIMIEAKGVNTAEKGMLGATMDFLALVPTQTKEGKEDFYVDVLDWKFTDINKERTDDIPWYKKTEWKAQMGEYSRILFKYGLKSTQLRKARMIPFIMNYEYSVKGDIKSKLVPSSIEVADMNDLKKSELYLLPVPTMTETTGNIVVDKFIRALQSHYEKLMERRVDKGQKSEELNKIEAAIRKLHVQMNFEPLYGVAKTFIVNTLKSLQEYKTLNYSSLSLEEISAKLSPLNEYKESALKFMNIDEVFLSTVDVDKLSSEEKALMAQFTQIAGNAKVVINLIEEIQEKFAIEYAKKQGIVTEENAETITQSEKVLDNISKTFLTSSKLAPKVIQLAVVAWRRAKGLVDLKINNKINEYSKVLLPVEEEAAKLGKSAFELIGEVRGNSLKLIRKIDSEFYKQIKEAKDNNDKQFIIKNIDIEKYKELAEKHIEEESERIKNSHYAADEEVNDKIRNAEFAKIKKAFDITRDDFNGFKNKKVGFFIRQALKTENHISKEYLSMSNEAKALWQFFTELNEKARENGYISKQGLSFFPLIEGSILEKLGKTTTPLDEMWEIVKGGTTVKINEEATYSKIDEETGEVKRTLRKYFTKTDQDIHQLSRDLARVGPLFIKALYEYENKQKMESVLQTLQAVENSKHNLVVDNNGYVVTIAGEVQETSGENRNAPVLKAIIDSYIYDLMEDASSLGNVQLGSVVSKFSKDEDSTNKTVISVKKIMRNTDTLVRVLGVGAKPILGITNWMGQMLHAVIRSGDRYTTGEYQTNNAKITSSLGMSIIEKALLNKFIPLNEDVSVEGWRKIAKKESLIKYLSTWSFTDVMMATNSYPERKLQFANAMSFLDNTIIVEGKLVNIRQYLKKQDAAKKFEKDNEGNYTMPFVERAALDKTFEKRVKELKESSSLKKVATVTDEDVIIPGVSEEEISNYRLHIMEFARKLNGQMSPDDMAAYRKDTILRSFMMFKTWIPPMLTERAMDIHKNEITGDWEYGRTRAFIKTWVQACNWNILRMTDIIKGTDKGLELLDEMLERKRNEYFKKTGQELEITREEFHQMIQEELAREARELGLVLSSMSLVLLAAAAKPPEDATDYEKNMYKWWARLTNKIVDELAFYYNPVSFESITKGTILPSIGLLSKASRFISALEKETQGYIIDDEKMMKEAYPIKYFLNIIPGLSQLQTDYLPFIFPEVAKEMGIRVNTQSRRQ